MAIPISWCSGTASWDRERHQGWIVASNDGLGRFEPTQEEALSTTPSADYTFINLRGSDFDGDGLLDLVVTEDGTVEVWYNWGDGFDPVLQLFDIRLMGLADGDGDGDADLLIQEFDDSDYVAPSQVTLWINNGYDFVDSERFALDSEERRWPLAARRSISRRKPPACCGFHPVISPKKSNSWQLTRPWVASAEPPLLFEAPNHPCNLRSDLIADLDGNGTVDLLGSPAFFGAASHGLILWRLDRCWRVDAPFLARLEGDPVHSHHQRPQRRWRTGCNSTREQLAHWSGTGGIARPAQRRPRPRRLLPSAKRGQSGPHQRCQRRWRHRSGRAGNESRKWPWRRLSLYQPRHPRPPP